LNSTEVLRLLQRCSSPISKVDEAIQDQQKTSRGPCPQMKLGKPKGL
jgi:hypothetical protein